jgi:predicted RNA-binding protein YlxR (DUF448 family)
LPDSGHKAQRTCLGCRAAVEQDALVRYVLSPEGKVLVDYGRKLPGRGAYTHFNPLCLRAAIKRRQFDRAFRGSSQVDEKGLLADLRTQVRERLRNLLGMTRKAGQAVSGSSLVLAALESQVPPILVVLAEDISPDIGEKVTRRAAKAQVACFRLFDKDLLGHVLGKGERSVVAFRESPLAASIHKELVRLEQIAGES